MASPLPNTKAPPFKKYRKSLPKPAAAGLHPTDPAVARIYPPQSHDHQEGRDHEGEPGQGRSQDAAFQVSDIHGEGVGIG